MSKYLAALKKYATFSGRSTRSEYWFFLLFFLLIYIAALIVDDMIGMLDVETMIGPVSGIVILGHMIPSIAVAVRRLHDWNKTGWLYLVSLIPLIGIIFLIVIGCIRGTAGPNRYGPDPLGTV